MADYCDGTLYKSSPFFTAHPDALQIHLYYDEIDVSLYIRMQIQSCPVLTISCIGLQSNRITQDYP